MMRVAGFVAVLVVAGVTPPIEASAQGPATGRCELVFPNTPSTRATFVEATGGGHSTFLGGGVVAYCRGQNINLRSDSAEYFESRQLIHLIGNVHYDEPRIRLDSRRLTYFIAEERLLGEGDVDAVLPNGSTLRGPQVEYFRAAAGVRDRSRMVAPGRPTIGLVQTDTAGRVQPPVNVVANRVVMEADSLIFAAGNVNITRPDVVARGDSAFMDSGSEFARLMRTPSIEGTGERPFRLTGFRIDLFSEQRQLERVLSAGTARAVSEDLDLRSDTIDLRVSDSRLERAIAWGPTRAVAVNAGSVLIADSLDIRMPGQRLDEIRALGAALAESTPDTTKIRSMQRDWLRGDSITAFFESAPAPPSPAPVTGSTASDTTSQPRIERLVAHGNARSFYQIPSDRGGTDAPAINYVRGASIVVAFRDQEVVTVTVDDEAVGLHLEPVLPGEAGATTPARAPATSVRVRPPNAPRGRP